MKKVLCALVSCAIFVMTAIGFSGCGCSNQNLNNQNSNTNNNNEPGYKIEPTQPDLKEGDFGFFIIDGDKLMVSEYTGSSTDIAIPETYSNYTVTIIGSNVFNGNDNITSVTMPDTITEIQDYAFSSCHKLTSVKLSENLKVFGNCVFFNCPELKSVELPATITDIGTRAFSATGIESIVIPNSDSFSDLGEFTFYQCQKLKEVTIPETITSIYESTFADCPNKITIKTPNGSYAQSFATQNGYGLEIIEQW